ncbi:MAG: CBS domain-containing protein, partial [Planctomycetota bacterium]
REAKLTEKMSALTAATLTRQEENRPVHEWDLASLAEAKNWKHVNHRLDQYMTTKLYTVHENEVIDLVANVMDWTQVRHVPVEDDHGKLVGLVSYRSLLRMLARDYLMRGRASAVPVSEVMQRELVIASPKTTLLEAIELMRTRKVSCLPVVTDGRLVGIVTERDFLRVARELLEASFKVGQGR